MEFKINDWIQHATFGNGLVSEIDGNFYAIKFVLYGDKKILRSLVQQAGSPPSAGFIFPKASVKASKSSTKLPARSSSKNPAVPFEVLVQRFLGIFKDGFNDKFFDDDERQYKQKAVIQLKDLLNLQAISVLLKSKDYSEISRRAKAVVNSTNLIFKQEKIKLLNGLAEEAGQQVFAQALFRLLYVTESEETGFDAFCMALGQLGALSWTTATYFQFLATDGVSMFMKPGVVKPMAETLDIALNYKSVPNWLTYCKLQEMTKVLDSRLQTAGLIPIAGTDLQSFIWTSVKAENGEY